MTTTPSGRVSRRWSNMRHPSCWQDTTVHWALTIPRIHQATWGTHLVDRTSLCIEHWPYHTFIKQHEAPILLTGPTVHWALTIPHIHQATWGTHLVDRTHCALSIDHTTHSSSNMRHPSCWQDTTVHWALTIPHIHQATWGTHLVDRTPLCIEHWPYHTLIKQHEAPILLTGHHCALSIDHTTHSSSNMRHPSCWQDTTVHWALTIPHIDQATWGTHLVDRTPLCIEHWPYHTFISNMRHPSCWQDITVHWALTIPHIHQATWGTHLVDRTSLCIEHWPYHTFIKQHEAPHSYIACCCQDIHLQSSTQ